MHHRNSKFHRFEEAYCLQESELWSEDVKRTEYFQQFTKIGRYKEKRRFWHCKKCGTKNPVQVKACVECGTSVKNGITVKE